VEWGVLDSHGLGQGPVGGFCEQDNEPSGSIRREDFLFWLGDC